MKTIIYKALILFSITLVMLACKSDDMEYHDPTVTAVDGLYAPLDNQMIELSSQPGASLLFQWSPSHAQDGQLVAYEVIFCKDSESKNPVYRVASDNSGKELYATISHLDINKACAAAGIATGEVGDIYWSVVSWRGISSAVCTQINKLTVTRLEGFEVIPNKVYLTGDATESGAELSKALVMQKVEEGKFEIYTELKNTGSFVFVDRISTDAEKYYIDLSGRLSDADNDETSTVSEKSVYRITLDFTNKGVTITKINDMIIRHIWTGTVMVNLSYVGNGVWEGSSDNFVTSDGSRDDRYKIRMGTENGNEWWGPVNRGEDGRPSGNEAYYNMKIYDNSDNWNPKWKFVDGCWGKKANAKIILTGGSTYTHSIEYN